MTQDELYASVARQTGESLRRIRRLGFSLVRPYVQPDPEPDRQPQMIDWDDVYRIPARPGRPRAKRFSVSGR